MNKRPLLILGAAAVLASVFLVRFFGHVFYPPSDLNDGASESFACRIYSMEDRSGTMMIYVYRGRFRLLLTASSGSAEVNALKTGNTILADCRYIKWNKARNKGNFDEEDHYRSLGIYRKYRLKSFIITDAGYSPIREFFRSLRDRLSSSIRSCADPECGGILDALATGYRTGMDEDTKDLFRMSGISHVIAISGLHVSFIGMGLFRLLRKRFRFNLAAACAVLTIAGYSIMSGGSASSVRACVMMAVNLGAVKAGRKYDMLSSLSLAAVLLLVSNPFYVTNTGFILSVTAVLSIAVISGPVSDFAAPGKGSRGPLVKAVRAAASSLTISAATLPLIISMYYEYPVFAPVCNILVLAAMPYILAGTLAGGFAGIIHRSAGRLLMGMPVYLTKAVMRVCRLFSLIPGSMVTTGNRGPFIVIIYYGLIIASLIAVRTANKRAGRKTGDKDLKKIMMRTAAVIAAYMSLLAVISVKTPYRGLEITFLDVDQGESILIIPESGTVYLIDAGSSTISNVSEYRINSALRYKGIDTIDYMIITHPDTDHVSGVAEMLKDSSDSIGINNLMIADFEGNEMYDELIMLAEKRKVNVISLGRGMFIRDGKLEMECLHPFDGKTYAGTNEKSAVMLLKYGNFSALFTGDISSEEEKDLLMNGFEGIHADLLDVAHHGSESSSCSGFLDSVCPDYAVISAGVSNPYGHPHRETLNRLKDAGSQILCTNMFGEIWFRTDGSNDAVVEWMITDGQEIP